MALIEDIKNDLEAGSVKMIHEYRDVLFADAVRLLGDQHEAEDLVFRVFETIIAKIDTYDVEKGGFLTWARGIMRNEASLMKRGKVAKATIPIDPDELRNLTDDYDVSTEKEILLNSDSELLHEAFKTLPKEMQDAMFLHYVSDLSIAEVAKLLKVQPGTVKMRLHRARKFLLHRLESKMKGKKPLAILLCLLLGAGALFGAWQAVEAIFTAPAPTPTPTSTPTAADPTEPVMTYPTFSNESTTEHEVNKPKESTMTSIKKTMLAATAAVSLLSTANADLVADIKARIVPAGAVTTQVGEDAGAFSYILNDGAEQVVVFATVGTHTCQLPPNVDKITYLVVGGGGSGSCGVRGGGGGAGGFVCKEDVSVVAGDMLTANVGDGGAQSGKWSEGNNGYNSTLTGTDLNVVAYGGGGGKTSAVGGTGGSGGGGATAGSPIDLSQGYPGGAGAGGSSGTAPGGGGAGGPGADGGNGSGKGGDGRSTMITGKEVYFAGGGRGGFGSAGGEGGGGGEGPGEDGTGGGGGGGSYSGWYGYKGGSGIVIIRWVIPKVSSTVTVKNSGTGSGSVSGTGEYVEGTKVALEATANEGSHFAGWSWEATLPDAKADGETLTFTMIAAPVEITAKFDEDIAKGVTVTFEGGNYGTPNPDYGTYVEYADGTERTYTMNGETVIPQREGVNAYFAGWKLMTGTGELVRDSKTGLRDGESISQVKFTCGTSDAYTLVWIWETRYTLMVVANPVEGGTVTGAGDYAAGSEVTLTANVTGGYKLTGWTGVEGMDTSITFTMPAEPTTVTANFAMVPWGITVVSGVSTNDYRDRCEIGSNYQFQSPLYFDVQECVSRKHCLGYTLTPMREDGEESELKEAALEGETLTATVTYSEPVRLTWKWVDDYHFTLTKEGEGTVTGPVDGWYASGTPFELTATPASSYEFLCWMGSVSGTDTTISGTIVKPMNVKAHFSLIQQVKSDWEAVEQDSVVLPAKTRKVKSLDKTYCVVVFTNSTAFTIPKKVTSIDCLVIGGGGGGGAMGGSKGGGGGGAGGLIYKEGVGVVAGDVLSVTVGAGGACTPWSNGLNGEHSSLKSAGGLNECAYGGGGGTAWDKYNDDTNKVTLASGGGGSGDAASDGGLYDADLNQGHAGGKGIAGATCGAGGGGAGGAGKDAGDGQGGPGVLLSITGEPVWYAAGGAGGKSTYEHGLYGSAQSSWNGIESTGGGGGGGVYANYGSNGGSGVVIIRYAEPTGGLMLIVR